MARPILVLALLAAGALAGPVVLGPRYKDESDGFQIQLPRKWEEVPTKFQDVAVVGKWVEKRAKYGRRSSLLYVLRFLHAGGEKEPETPADAVKRGIPGYGSMLRFQPKSIWEYAERLAFGRKLDVVEEDREFRMARKGLKAHLRVYRQRAPEGASGRDLENRLALMVVAEIDTVESSDSTYGVLYLGNVGDERDLVPSFKRSIRGFRILEPDTEDDEEGAPTDADIFVDSAEKPEAWRRARKAKLIPGWGALDTENYLIVYNKEVKKPLLRAIARHIEAIREQIYEQLFPPSREVKAISVVRVCKDRAEYHRYGGPGGSAGYWSRGDEELVFYQDKSNKKDSLRVLYHEAFHQYIHYAVGDVAPHSWFNEGHGDYFAGHNFTGRKFKSAPFRWRTGIIANALSSGSYVPLRKFLKYSQAEYYANPGLCYAQGWSLVYFLREVERRKIKKYKQYWGLLDRYFEAIKRNVKSVKEKGLEGLREPPPEPADPTPPESETETEKEPPGLPRLPGLEQPFPGEHPEAGAGAGGPRGETRSVAGPRISGVRSALDVAVDEALRGIDLERLERDWVEFSK